MNDIEKSIRLGNEIVNAFKEKYPWQGYKKEGDIEALQTLIASAELLDRVGAVMPEKKELLIRHGKPQNTRFNRRIEGFNEARDLCTAAIAGKVGRIREVLVKVYGCKKSKEDCNFKHCNHWATCERLEEELTTLLLEG